VDGGGYAVRLQLHSGSRMSLWPKLFGRAAPARLNPSPGQRFAARAAATRALLADESSKQVVRGAMERLGAAGLRIRPKLDRDLIVVRCLRVFADRCEPDQIAALFKENGRAERSVDRDVFCELASETDTFLDFEEADAVLPQCAELSDEELGALLDVHSYSIFENAVMISIVNDGVEPDEYVRHHVDELAGLAFGDFEVASVDASREADRIVGRVTVVGGQSASFDFSAEKRPDLTPVFKAMNVLVAPLGTGRFVGFVTGCTEDVIAIYLRPGEQVAFRAWEERTWVGGDSPVDWFG
jgi:hypothetical protein